MSASDSAGKVLHVASVYPSSSNRLALQFGYVRVDWRIELLHLTDHQLDVPRVDQGEYQIRTLPHSPGIRAGDSLVLRKCRSLMRRFVNLAALCAILIRSDADMMHAHENSSLWALAFWVLVLRRSGIWDPHDYFHEQKVLKGNSFRRATLTKLERIVVSRGTPILTVSNGMKEVFASMYPLANIRVIKNYSIKRSTAIPQFDSAEKVTERLVAQRRQIGAEAIRLVYPGLIKPERFTLGLIKKLGSMKGIRLDIYGEDRSGHSAYQRALVGLLREYNIDNVRLCGRYTSSNIVSILSDYHFALFPFQLTRQNIDFCLPNKFFQCIEAGLPMITSSMKEMGGIITEHGLGYVFPADEDDSCADILSTISVSGDDYLSLVRNVVTYYTGKIDYSYQRSQLLDAYAAATNRH